MTAKSDESQRNDPEESGSGNYSDPRVRWPDRSWSRTEQPAGEWPHSRATGQEPVSGTGFTEPPDIPAFGQDGGGEGSGLDANNGADERIRKEISEDLNADPECDTTKITVAVRDGAVVLEGRVPTRPMKHRATEIANAARDVRSVDNRLQVV